MTQQTEMTTMQRKAGAGCDRADGAGMTPQKSLRLALAKAAQDELSLALRAQEMSEELLNQAGLISAVNEDGLLLLLQGPMGAMGIVSVDIQMLSAVIEVQTMGKVNRREAPDRRPTNTDAAMLETLLNATLNDFAINLEGSPAQSWATGFQFGERVENARLLGLRLEDIEYRIFRATLDFADGAKQGDLLIALPAAGNVKAGTKQPAQSDWSSDLRQTVYASHGEITAILYRAMVPLNEARNFKTGDLVPIPVSALTDIMMEGVDGRIVGRAKLGQKNGFRALRMADPAESEVSKINRSRSENLATVASQPAPVAADPAPMESRFPEDDPAPLQIDPLSEPMNAIQTPEDFPDLAVGDLPMQTMADLPDLPVDNLEMQPMAAMPMDMAIGTD